jgi:hypothetical protein
MAFLGLIKLIIAAVLCRERRLAAVTTVFPECLEPSWRQSDDLGPSLFWILRALVVAVL